MPGWGRPEWSIVIGYVDNKKDILQRLRRAEEKLRDATAAITEAGYTLVQA